MENTQLVTMLVLGALGGMVGLIVGLAIGQAFGAAGKIVGVALGVAGAAASALYLSPAITPLVQDVVTDMLAPDPAEEIEAKMRTNPLIDAYFARYPDEAEAHIARLRAVSNESGGSAVDREIARLGRQVELQTYGRAVPLAPDETVRAAFDSLRQMLSLNRSDPAFCRAYGMRPDMEAAAAIYLQDSRPQGHDEYLSAMVALLNAPTGRPPTITFAERNDLLRPVGTALRATRPGNEQWYWDQRRPRTDTEYLGSCEVLIRMLGLIATESDDVQAMRAFFDLSQPS